MCSNARQTDNYFASLEKSYDKNLTLLAIACDTVCIAYWQVFLSMLYIMMLHEALLESTCEGGDLQRYSYYVNKYVILYWESSANEVANQHHHCI